MRSDRIVHSGSFEGVYSDTGEPVTIEIFTKMLDTTDSQYRSEIPGPISLQTSLGKRLNKIADGVYEEFDTHREIRSNSPDTI